jgi:hypothetical protein
MTSGLQRRQGVTLRYVEVPRLRAVRSAPLRPSASRASLEDNGSTDSLSTASPRSHLHSLQQVGQQVGQQAANRTLQAEQQPGCKAGASGEGGARRSNRAGAQPGKAAG